MEAYLPTLGLKSVQSNVKQYLLFKSFFSSGQYFNIAIKIITCNRSQHATYPSDTTHISTPFTQAPCPHHPRKHATHVTHSSTLARHLRKHATHVTHAKTRHPYQHERQVISQTLICQTQQFSKRILADILALLFVYCC